MKSPMPDPKAADEKPLPVDALARELAALARGSPTMSARDLAQAIFRVYGPQVGEALRDILNKSYPMFES